MENNGLVNLMEQKEGNKANYNAIDLIKFICAILVCILHMPPFGKDTEGVLYYFNYGFTAFLCRLAVPFYFICSGFFLFYKLERSENKNDVLKNYIFKILRLLGIWTVILFVGWDGHLWYLGATIVAIMMVYVLLKMNIKCRYLLLVVGGLYIIGLLGDSYYGLFKLIEKMPVIHHVSLGYNMLFDTTRNGVFMGSMFVAIGACFAKKKIDLNLSVSVIGFIISMILLLGEVFMISQLDWARDYNMYIFFGPC